VVAIGGLFAALPPSLAAGPRWLLLATVLALLAPTIISHLIGHHSLNQILGYVVNGVVTVAMIVSLGLLIDVIMR